MTEDTTYPDRNGDDLLAAEYVLGVLDHDARNAAARRMHEDAGFAALVQAWENDLAPLNDDYEEVPAPAATFAKIETRLFDSKPSQPLLARLWGATGLWRGLAAASLTVLVLGTGLFFTQQKESGPSLVSALEAPGSDLRFVALYDSRKETLKIRRIAGADAAADKAYELWVIAANAKPVSLGLVAANDDQRALPASLASLMKAGATLAVSLEPSGGSPTGQPTGPVVALGAIKTI